MAKYEYSRVTESRMGAATISFRPVEAAVAEVTACGALVFYRFVNEQGGGTLPIEAVAPGTWRTMRMLDVEKGEEEFVDGYRAALDTAAVLAGNPVELDERSDGAPNALEDPVLPGLPGDPATSMDDLDLEEPGAPQTTAGVEPAAESPDRAAAMVSALQFLKKRS